MLKLIPVFPLNKATHRVLASVRYVTYQGLPSNPSQPYIQAYPEVALTV